MKRIALVLAAAFVLLAQSCMDAEPAEISVRASIGGQPTPCTVKLYNSKHVQIKQEATDTQGLVFLKALTPGDYYLSFVDYSGNPYPAERKVTLTGGASEIVDVDLNEAPAAPAGGS